MSELLDEFEWRGLVSQVSDRPGLADHLESGSRTIYAGFDPTADSLHHGHLVPLLMLRRAQLAGHRPVVLVGGATGLIGDPSFRDDERSLNSPEVVAGWVEKIRKQVAPFVSFEGENAAIVANNLDWTAELDVITYLRNIGKHFSVNAMIQRDSVRMRLEREGQGISYTEFSYMLLQAMDFLELARRHGCTVQVGGSDQWGNIVSGIDLIRRELSEQAFGLTVPLVTKADGSKFGKTAGGAVWLDPAKTSPYAFYQFWLNTADADVVNFLRTFTFLDREAIDALAVQAAESPQAREAQRRLAEDVTRLVHGDAALASARRITDALFGGDIAALAEQDYEQLAVDGVPRVDVEAGTGLLSALTEAGLTRSVGEARKLVKSRGISLNGDVVQDERLQLEFEDAPFGRYLLARKGKKSWLLITAKKS